MTKVALVYVTFDGVDSFYCGVGAITQYFLNSFPGIQEQFKEEKIDISLHLLYSSVPSDFNKNNSFQKRFRFTRNNVIKVPLKHGMEVSNPFGTYNSWSTSCEEANSYISKLTNKYESVLVIANDTPFGGLAQIIYRKTNKKIRFIWIPHSTGRIWNRGIDISDIKRDNWENLSIASACNIENVYLGYISKYMGEHLLNDWAAPQNKLLPFINGVSENYLNNYEKKPLDDIERLLQIYRIPLNTPLFLSFARAQWYKGLDLSAKLGASLAKNFNVHPVIFALDDRTGQAKSIINQIKRIFEENQQSYTLLTRYPTLLPRWLMQWPLCRGVGVLSRREPFGLIPSEFRVLGPEDGFTITSNTGGLLEQTQSVNEGAIVPIEDEHSLSSDEIENVLNRWGNSTQFENNKAAYTLVNKNYNIKTNMYQSIRNALWL